MPSTGLDLLGSTRRLLLTAVKEHGSVSVGVLAEETFLTPSAVRQHLMALASQGTVHYTEMRQGPGRPKHLFSLTAQGEALFPQRYDSLSELFMTALEGEEQSVIDRVLNRVSEMAFDREAQNLKDSSGWERVEAMTAVLDNLGYFPKLDQLPDGRARLALLHCPLKNVAVHHPRVCWSEQQALSRALGQELQRDEYRNDGAAVCAYIINLPEASAG